MRRRELLKSGAIASLALACSGKTNDEPAAAAPLAPEALPPLEPGVVRVASVRTAVEGGVLPALIERFEHSSDLRVRVTTGVHVYDLAREGKVDVVISHFGHKDAEAFVVDGLGEFPRLIFSNQMALFGPPHDPAGVRGLDDLAEAFRRIAATRSPYLLNDQDGVRYFSEILWNASGKPDRTGWWLDPKVAHDAAITQASDSGAYALWGLTPFLRLDNVRKLVLEPLVVADPLLQRVMCSIIVKASGPRRTNTAGAFAFQSFLLAPETQAAIRTVHYPGKHAVSWSPAGRNNRTAILPKV
jgi:tungstate transport system substrate-binding protein